MVFEIKYEWEIKDVSSLTETEGSLIYSPVFSASPDEICHRWKLQLLWKPKYPQHYGVYLWLYDAPFHQPISMHFEIKVFNKENKIVAKGELSDYHTFEGREGWGKSRIISLCDKNSIQKIVLNIKLV